MADDKAALFAALLENGQEIELYMFIESAGGFIFYMEHDMADGRIPEKDWPAIDRDIANVRAQQLLVAAKLTRFGITANLPDGSTSTDYWKWYHWWSNYIRSLSDEEYQFLNRAISQKKDLSTWQPQGSWQSQTQ